MNNVNRYEKKRKQQDGTKTEAKCNCKGNLVFGYAKSRNGYYYLLLTTNRLEQLHDALLKDMLPCPIHYKETGVQCLQKQS